MAVTFEAKTEVALTTNPQTISYPASTAVDDWLILIAVSATSSATLAPTALHLSRWRWTHLSQASAGSNMSVLVAWKRYLGSDTAVSIGTATTGYALMYRYSGVGAVRVLSQAGAAVALQDTPYVTGTSGEEIIWYGAQRRTGTPAPATALSRGSLETNQNANFATLVAYREALGADVSLVQATMSNSGSAATYSNAGAVVLSGYASHIYKGRDEAADDDTGAA